MSTREQRPLVMRGGLVVAAAVWMIAAVGLALGPRSPVQPTAASFEPAVHIILLCVGVGLIIAWPLLRLSQERAAHPMRQIVLDLAVLLSLLQLVVWLPRVLTVWSVSRTAAISALLAAWAVLAGAMLAAVIGSSHRGPRNVVMLVCIVLCLLGPAAIGLAPLARVDAGTIVKLGPLMGVLELASGGSSSATQMQWNAVMVVAAAALAAWCIVIVKTAVVRWRR